MSEIPEISIAVCTYNRADVLPKCLDSLAKQSVDPSIFEVVIVDNNSTDGTKKIADEFCAKFPNFRYVFEKRQGHSQARNRAIAEAKGEYLAFIDDDAFADKDWVKSILECFAETDADVIGGPIRSFVDSGKIPAFYNAKAYDFNRGSARKRMMPPKFDFGFPGGNSCYKRTLFTEIGSYSENFGLVNGKLQMGEDSEVGYRLLKAGKIFYYEPGMKIEHHLRLNNLTLAGMMKRSYNTGKGIGMIIKNDLTMTKKLKKIAAPFAYSLRFIFAFPFYLAKGQWVFAKKLSDIFFALGAALNVL